MVSRCGGQRTTIAANETSVSAFIKPCHAAQISQHLKSGLDSLVGASSPDGFHVRGGYRSAHLAHALFDFLRAEALGNNTQKQIEERPIGTLRVSSF